MNCYLVIFFCEDEKVDNKKFFKYDTALDKLQVYNDGNVLVSYNSDKIKRLSILKVILLI